MDLQTILVSVLSSSVVAGIIGYFFKQSFERSLDVLTERIKEENKAQIQEQVRRQAFVYNKQYEVLRLALRTTYRLRNALRDLSGLFASDISSGLTYEDSTKVNTGISEMESYGKAYGQILEQQGLGIPLSEEQRVLRDLLYDERAILPELLFKDLHDLNNLVLAVGGWLSVLTYPEYVDAEHHSEIEAVIQEAHSQSERLYHQLVTRVQSHLGTTDKITLGGS